MESYNTVQLPVAQVIQAQSSPGQPLQQGQQVHVQGSPSQQEPPQAAQCLDFTIDTDFLKSPLCHIKLAEFVVLLGAWTSVVKYFDDLQSLYEPRHLLPDDEISDLFRFITIFCWVLVILYLAFYTFSVPKICCCRRPSLFSLTFLFLNFIMFSLLLACSGNLVRRTVDWGNWLQQKIEPEYEYYEYLQYTQKWGRNTYRSILVTHGVASALGFLSCILFAVDMVLNYKMYQTQRVQETPPDQGPPQRRAWDVNKSFVRSPVFYVKLAEIALLFSSWVCMVKYFEDLHQENSPFNPAWPVEDSKADFLKGITIFSWVTAILLTLTSVLSFDKLCNRSSSWTLTNMIIYLILSILLIASCGNLIRRIVILEKYKKSWKPNVYNILALQVGLACGFLSLIAFIVDMVLNYKLLQTQRAQETSSDQGPPQRQAGDVNKNYLRSPLFYVRLAEIVLLFGAMVCILEFMYLPGSFDSMNFRFKNSKAVLFRGTTIFSWAMAMFLALTSLFSFDKLCKRSSHWTLMTMIIYFIMYILLIASCGNLTPRAVVWPTVFLKPSISVGLAFGFLSCMLFVMDMVLSCKMYRNQRAQETPSDQRPPQRRSGDVNIKYLRSVVFYAKLAESVFLFVAWTSMVNYLDFFFFEHLFDDHSPDKDLKADFFQGITVFCWVMVNILTLAPVFSFDKLCNRSSRWTLTTMIINLIFSILLIASCGYLTPRAVNLRKQYYSLKNSNIFQRRSSMALLIGTAFGYVSWIVFIVDIFLLFKLYRKQTTEEVCQPRAQQANPPLMTRQPAVVTDGSVELHFATYV